MNLRDRIWFMRRGMSVRRYHQHHLIDPENVGKHSAGVALFVNLVDPTARKEVIMYALTHDLGECVLGDIPAPTKKQLPRAALDAMNQIEDRALEGAGYEFHNLITDDESLLVKLADTLDGLMFCIEELNRGNKFLEHAGCNYSEYLHAHLVKCYHTPWYTQAQTVATVLQHEWSKF